MFRLRTFLATITAATLFAAPAIAHAMLESADPAVGADAAAVPDHILLVFSEGVEPLLSTITLTHEDGAPVALGRPHSDGSKQRLEAKVESALSPGRYHLSWRVVSVDGHRSQGDFSFTVGDEETPL